MYIVWVFMDITKEAVAILRCKPYGNFQDLFGAGHKTWYFSVEQHEVQI